MTERSHLCRRVMDGLEMLYIGKKVRLSFGISFLLPFWESGAWVDNVPEHLSDTQVVLVGFGSVSETEVI